MDRINPKNERIKRDYSEFLRDADQKAESTVRAIEKAILRYEKHTGFADFATFSRGKARSFRADLSGRLDGQNSLSPSTVLSTLKVVQRFFRWLALQPGMTSRIKTTDIEYLNLSEKEVRAAQASPSKPFPSMNLLRSVLDAMPRRSPLERRDCALFALIMMTGIRDNAAASLRLRHVDLDRQIIVQDPSAVRTKNSKLIESVLLPLGQGVEDVFFEWIAFLSDDLGWGPDDPVFPQTRTRIDPELGPVADEFKREIWADSAPIRAIFKRAFEMAEKPYFTPHRVRNSVVEYAYRICKTPEEFKAFSQNLGHASVMTTLSSYGTISLSRQHELIRNAGKGDEREARIDRLLELIEKQGS